MLIKEKVGEFHIKTIKIPILFCLVFSLNYSPAQAADYAFTSSVFNTYDYVSASTGGTLLELEDNAVSSPIDLGFSFDFYGTSYENVYISDNGAIGFDPTNLDTAPPPLTLPDVDAAEPNAVIAPFSSDLDPSQGGSIYTLSGGVEPERYFVVEWIGVPVKGKGGGRTFEVILYEDNNDILFQYRTLIGGDVISTGTVTVGIENQDGEKGLPDGTVNASLDLSEIAEGKSVLFSVSAPDSDSDGMVDRFESFYGLTDPLGDEDADGLSNLDEFSESTKPNQADTDGDGISDGNELNIGSDPKETDSDKDGIRDAKEDLNLDGVFDTGETRPGEGDTDSDGYNDAMEITFRADPLEPLSTPSLGYTKIDKENSGCSDAGSGSEAIPFCTIQAAIDAGVDGDILYIAPSPLADPYDEALSINDTNESITLIGADPDTTFLKGGITISGVENVTLVGFTILNADPAVQILGHGSSATSANLVNMTLKNCANGILISDAVNSGKATKAVLEQVSFTITEPMEVGYGVKVEDLQDSGDKVEINNSTFSLTGPWGSNEGAVLIGNCNDVTVRGCTVSSVYGNGIQVWGDGSKVTLDRNSVTTCSGHGVFVDNSADVTITDNSITSNKGYGIKSNSTIGTNSGNYVVGNTSGPYLGAVLDISETAASVYGVSYIDNVTMESAAWIQASSGGTVAVIDPPNILLDPIDSIFGTSIKFDSNALSEDTLVTISTTTESVPSLPVSYTYAMPVVEISLKNGNLSGTATVTLPVLASYDMKVAKVFHLKDGAWEELPLLSTNNYGETFLHQQASFSVESLSKFTLVLYLPLEDPGDTGGGGGCRLQKAPVRQGVVGGAFDLLILLLPTLVIIIKRRKARSL